MVRTKKKPVGVAVSTAKNHQVAVKWGRAIRRSRRALDITQADLARELDVQPAAVSSWERGLSAPSVSRLRGIARALGEDPKTFFELPQDDEGVSA